MKCKKIRRNALLMLVYQKFEQKKRLIKQSRSEEIPTIFFKFQNGLSYHHNLQQS